MTAYLIFGKIPRPEWFQLQFLEGTIMFRIVFLWVGFAVVKIDVETCIENMLKATKDIDGRNNTHS